MRHLVILLLTAALLFSACQTNPTSASGDSAKQSSEKAAPAAKVSAADTDSAVAKISGERILKGTEVMAADDMAGRATGTEGELKAAQWIADQYRDIGLKPMGDSQDFFQVVNLIGMKKEADATKLSLKGDAGEIGYKSGETLTFSSTSQKEDVSITDAPLLFVGYGVDAPEHEWNDYKDVDVKGKVLLYLNNDPAIADQPDAFGGEARTYYGRYTYKFEQAMKRGAAGAFIIHTTPSAGYGWSVIGTSGERESFEVKLPNSGYQLDVLGWMHQDLADKLAGTVGATLDQWFEMGNKRDFKPVELPITLSATIKTTLRETEARNVVGVWEGSDPQLKDEVVIFTAHYDHLGVKESGDGDRVYNGAWDNALGTAAIIEIARAFSESKVRPRRSVAFLACSAEERGLLGSKWFVEKPPIPMKNFVANLNVDMPQVLGLSTDMGAIGFESNQLGDWLVELAGQTKVTAKDGSEKNVSVKGDPNPNAGSFYRSDQANFVKKGVPAIFFVPGKDYVKDLKIDPAKFKSDHYHQVSDEINEHWDLTGCVRDMQIVMRLAIKVADNDAIPTWAAGNEFEGAWKALHGK
ncbi:M20/M25/M40 family metallo-hydrolase [Acanthopleuribacter pedis]|uniref:M20/M25/M40 family metallo-hydrolase n=1 Tax=Acanthopleuribacter pedis TaxID=442870 RepID=A0A8J7Q9I4_9BACT|nr:M20/M25/M40 family metallo-hydrolase [Acanthopleuribacter pedis]MBO1321136.1 M20/M25/M40 family metallo-hydrolase [Acanthopleuribacter pedis]